MILVDMETFIGYWLTRKLYFRLKEYTKHEEK